MKLSEVMLPIFSIVLLAGFIYVFSQIPAWGAWYGARVYFVLLAASVVVLPLALLLKKADLVFLVVGLLFLAQGINDIYSVSLGFRSGETLYDFLLGASIFGFPMAILSLSIFFLWFSEKNTSRAYELTQYGICVLLHIVNFGVAMLYPWSEITRFGGAGLAVVFAILNFIRLFKL